MYFTKLFAIASVYLMMNVNEVHGIFGGIFGGSCNDLDLWCPYGGAHQICTVGMCFEWSHMQCQSCHSVVDQCRDQCGRQLPSSCNKAAWRGRADGCSIPVPGLNEIWNEVFHSACDIHDLCYATPDAGQGNCDWRFYLNMLNICNAEGIGSLAGASCAGSASIIYGAVAAFGGDSYEGGQDFAHSNCGQQTSAIAGNYGYCDIVDTGGNGIKVQWKGAYGNRPDATGVYNPPVPGQAYGTGYVTFPDDRKYQLWFDPRHHGVIYWDSATSSNQWHKQETFSMPVLEPGQEIHDDNYHLNIDNYDWEQWIMIFFIFFFSVGYQTKCCGLMKKCKNMKNRKNRYKVVNMDSTDDEHQPISINN